jgi:hypothetical protein
MSEVYSSASGDKNLVSSLPFQMDLRRHTEFFIVSVSVKSIVLTKVFWENLQSEQRTEIGRCDYVVIKVTRSGRKEFHQRWSRNSWETGKETQETARQGTPEEDIVQE